MALCGRLGGQAPPQGSSLAPRLGSLDAGPSGEFRPLAEDRAAVRGGLQAVQGCNADRAPQAETTMSEMNSTLIRLKMDRGEKVSDLDGKAIEAIQNERHRVQEFAEQQQARVQNLRNKKLRTHWWSSS